MTSPCIPLPSEDWRRERRKATESLPLIIWRSSVLASAAHRKCPFLAVPVVVPQLARNRFNSLNEFVVYHTVHYYTHDMLTQTEHRAIARIQIPPWQYLEYASITSLQSFELNRLNHAANLLKQMQVLLQQYFDDISSANLARVFMRQPGASQLRSSHSGTATNHNPRILSLPLVRATLA
jgi:hypothetical protein